MKKNNFIIYLLLYVNDILVAVKDKSEIDKLKNIFMGKFEKRKTWGQRKEFLV